MNRRKKIKQLLEAHAKKANAKKAPKKKSTYISKADRLKLAAEATLRNESPADIEQIHAVTEQAFLNAPHTEHTEHTEQFIVKALRDAGALTVSLVAEHGARVIGHVAISPVSISDGAANWYGLGPISVLPAYQGKGVGAQLMEAALAAMPPRARQAVWYLATRITTAVLASGLSMAWYSPAYRLNTSRRGHLPVRLPTAR